MIVDDKEIYIKVLKLVDVLVKIIERFYLEQFVYYEYVILIKIKEV